MRALGHEMDEALRSMERGIRSKKAPIRAREASIEVLGSPISSFDALLGDLHAPIRARSPRIRASLARIATRDGSIHALDRPFRGMAFSLCGMAPPIAILRASIRPVIPVEAQMGSALSDVRPRIERTARSFFPKNGPLGPLLLQRTPMRTLIAQSRACVDCGGLLQERDGRIMSTKKQGKNDVADRAAKMIAGINKHLGGTTPILLAGGSFPPADVTSRLQTLVDLRRDVDTARRPKRRHSAPSWVRR
jgi:hypothetical protein